MTDQDNDDEIRESIPCVTVVRDRWDTECLPVGYDGRRYCRGVYLGAAYDGVDGAWKHAIEREKARREKAKDERRERVAERMREVARSILNDTCDEADYNAVIDAARMIEAGELP
jgi:hypothetical protein